jgi:hypothetical protein
MNLNVFAILIICSSVCLCSCSTLSKSEVQSLEQREDRFGAQSTK